MPGAAPPAFPPAERLEPDAFIPDHRDPSSVEEAIPRFRKEHGNARIAGEAEYGFVYARVTLAGIGGADETAIVLLKRFGNR